MTKTLQISVIIVYLELSDILYLFIHKSILTAAEVEKVRIEKYSISTSLLIRAALKKGLKYANLPENAVMISGTNESHYFKETSLPCNNMVSADLGSNKNFLRRLLIKENLPAPRTITLRHPAGWQKVLQSTLRFPLVVKPINAAHANGASMKIATPEELKKAVIRAFSFIRKQKEGDRVLVEEYFEGLDLRIFVVGDKVASAIQRDPAYVIGDGHQTIKQLVQDFNTQWTSKNKYELPLCPIPLDTEVTRYLAKSNLTLDSIVPLNQKTYLRWNANVSTGGRPIDVTDKLHPNLKKLAVRIAHISKLEVCGVDILCKDLESPDMSANNICILENNESPGFDIHYFPISGKGQDICTDILDHIFKTPVQENEAPST